MAKAEMTAAIAALSITAEFEFVPWSKSRSAKGPHKTVKAAKAPTKVGESTTYVDEVPASQKNLNWRVRIITKRGGCGPWIDYSAGIAHAPAYKRIPGGMSVAKAEKVEYEVETGKIAGALGFFNSEKQLPPPEFEDVLYCLASDSDVLDHANFESWAEEYGYNVDSRKDEAVYRECLQQTLAFRALVGDEGLKMLREASQDF